VFADDFGGTGPGGQLLISYSHVPVIKGMFGREVFGKIDFSGWIHVGVFFGGHAGIVGCGVRDVDQKRLVGIVLPDEIYSGVTEVVAGEFFAGESPTFGIFLLGVEMIQWNFQMVRHAAEKYIFAVVEGSGEGIRTVVPLAGAEGVVAGLLKDLWER